MTPPSSHNRAAAPEALASSEPDSLESSRQFWDAAADGYDQSFAGTSVGKLWRAAVWRELDASFHTGTRVIELNCGTGLDAVHLAQRGVSVLACDISPRMIAIASENAHNSSAGPLLDFRVVATEHLSVLGSERHFDGAFSNFSGLNCVRDMAAVSRGLARLLKPGAPLLLCMLGTRWVLGSFWRRTQKSHTSSRSIRKRSGVEVYRHLPAEIITAFAPHFALRHRKGIGITVPPSFAEHWALRFPCTTRALVAVDRFICELAPFHSLGGCIVFEFIRTPEEGPS